MAVAWLSMNVSMCAPTLPSLLMSSMRAPTYRTAQKTKERRGPSPSQSLSPLCSPLSWMWPHSLGDEFAEELLGNGLLVPPGCRLSAGWDISLDKRVVCLLPSIDSDEMLYLVLHRRSQLPPSSNPMRCSGMATRAGRPSCGRAREAD